MSLTIKLCTYAKVNCFKCKQIIYIKMDLALNNLQRLMCHKTKQTKPNQLNFLLYFMSNTFFFYPSYHSLSLFFFSWSRCNRENSMFSILSLQFVLIRVCPKLKLTIRTCRQTHSKHRPVDRFTLTYNVFSDRKRRIERLMYF